MKPACRTFAYFLVTLLLVGMLGGPDSGYRAQAEEGPSIDDVINQLDRDFTFGGKEDLKRDNIQQTNEQNREDIKIQEEEQRQAAGAGTNQTTVNFSIIEFGSPNGFDKLQVVFAGQTIANNLDGASVTPSVMVAQGSTQTLTVTCVAALSVACDYEVNIVSGATFSPSGTSTGFQSLGVGTPAVYTINVS